MRVVLTGGTGLIGMGLAESLLARGDQVSVISRDADRARRQLGARVDVVAGDPVEPGPWQGALAGADAVVSLAGEPVGHRRWNAQFRQRIRDSRVDATRFVVEAIAAAEPARRPRVLISASGIDYYPSALDLAAHADIGDDDDIDESTPPGDSFLARVCRDWEREAFEATALGVRVVTARIGLVLAPRGDALARLVLPFKLFAGGPIGSGRQWTSWIHIEDVIGALEHALDRDDVVGPMNVVAPGTVRNRDFARALGRALHRPSWFRAPGFAVRLVVGELAEYALSGRRVVPARLLNTGFSFRHPDIAGALADLL